MPTSPFARTALAALIAATASTSLLAQDSSTRTVPRAAFTLTDAGSATARASHVVYGSRTQEGATIGVLGGAIAGAALIASSGGGATVGAMFGASAGMLIGGTVGKLTPAPQTVTLEPGITRARLSAPSLASGPIVGAVVSLGTDSVVLSIAGDAPPIRVPRSAITQMDLHMGRQSNLIGGAVVGAVAGGIVGVIAGASCDGGWGCPGPLLGGAVMAGVFAPVGALIGAFSSSDRWARLLH